MDVAVYHRPSFGTKVSIPRCGVTGMAFDHPSHLCFTRFWYPLGELKFFDNYIIPLARKLKECNIFGVSSDECLNYAVSIQIIT